ncbi:unnamed protein product [Amaranthus hypochondriacus]
MKQTPSSSATQSNQETTMDAMETSFFDSTTDICTQLLQRYSSSSAPQHRHLTATAAAIKSLLLEDSLPLSPFSYFAAVMTALSQPLNDAASASALATLLSIVLPLIPESSISAEKAYDAVAVLVKVLGSEERELVTGSASSARCVVKSLGILLGFCDSKDWNSVELGFKTLANWCIDKRPKVRKCALVYLENALKSFQSGNVKKKASKLILSLLETYMSTAVKLGVLQNVDVSGYVKQYEAEQSDIVHALSLVRVSLPYLGDKRCGKIILKLIELLDSCSSTITRPVLNVIEAFLEGVEDDIITSVAVDIIDALSSYVSVETNTNDGIISAANLLKISLDKLHAKDFSKWKKSFSSGVDAIAGLLTRENDIALKSSNILKNMICEQLSDAEIQSACDLDNSDKESQAIASMCSTFLKLLDSFAGTSNEQILAVLSVLFLKLGSNSFSYMRNIVLKLAEMFTHADGNKYEINHLQICFGCAVVAMGVENILTLVPISFNVETSTCANMWMIPILKNYTCGASLEYFVEHIAPIAQSLQKASRKVKKSVIGQDLQAYAHGLWGLVPAFCRHPTDISKSFHSFAKLMLVRLKKDAFLLEDIAQSFQELVTQNKGLPKPDAANIKPREHPTEFCLDDYLLEKRNMFCYSKKAAARNLKALSLYSNELLLALMKIFLDSTPEKRSYLKKAIGCLASVSNSSVTKEILISSLGRFPLVKAVSVYEDSDSSNALPNETSLDSSSVDDNSQWSLILDLASSIVEGADEDLIRLIFGLAKHALQTGDGVGITEAYYTLSCILKEHPWFCSSKMEDLVDFIIGLKSPADIASFTNRLSCLYLLLVHALKNNSDVENTKPFHILNEVILALKDSREEARKAAYDVLLRISSCLEDSSSADCDGPYYRLINMILGYLSGPSPHITSAAISALSVLVFKEPDLCLKVPDMVSSIASLLQTKAVETIKAVLGFIKVLVSCLDAKDLQNFVPVIVDGVAPWSSVSRHHFRSKVTVILEIMIRKCGLPTIKLATPERYESFIRKVSQNRHGKTTSEEAGSDVSNRQLSDAPVNRPKKRSSNEMNDNRNGSKFQMNKRRKSFQNYQSPGAARRTGVGFDKKTHQFKHRQSKFGQNEHKRNFHQASESNQMKNRQKYGHKGRPRR